MLFQIAPSGTGRSTYEAAAEVGAEPHLMLINVSPIEYGHVLLIPRTTAKLP